MEIKTNIRVPADLQKDLVDFAFSNTDKFVGRFPLVRRFCNLNEHELALTDRVKEFASESYSKLGVDTVHNEHLLGNFITVNNAGGFTHNHTDENRADGYWHVRLNFMLQKPESGGEPIICNHEFSINEGESWINFAYKWQHSSTPVIGKRPRVVLSLGNYIEPAQAQALYERTTGVK
jgi:hypothetical protein